MTTTLATYVPPEQDRGDILWDPLAFRHTLDVAGMLAGSQMIPKQFQGKPADVLIGLQLAHRMRMDPLTTLQSMQVINGAPSWKATFIIARLNSSGKFSDDIDWEVKGAGDSLAVTAFATRASNGRRVEAEASMAMAKAEGWTRNDKYRSMPVQMLKYRSATFLARLHAPEVLLGLPTADEIEDVAAARGRPVIDIESAPSSPVPPVAPAPESSEGASAAPPPPPTTSESRGVTPGSGGGGQPDPERVAAMERLKAAEAKVETSTRDAIRRQHELRRISPQTSTTRIVALAVAMEEASQADSRPSRAAEEREDLLAQLTVLAADLPEATRKSLREQHGVTDLRTLPLDRLLTFVAASRGALADHLRTSEWTDPGSPIEPALTDAVADWELKYSDAGREGEVPDMADRAGLPIRDGYAYLDGAPDSMKRRYLHEMSSAWERS